MYTGMSSTKATNIVLIILLRGMSTRRGIREEIVVTPKEHLTNHYRWHVFFPFLSSSRSIKEDFSKTINLVAKPFLILRRFKTHLLGVCLMELDPQPDYELFHHMAVVSPVAAMWYIIGLLKKKKKEDINPPVFFTKPTGTSSILLFVLLSPQNKSSAAWEKKDFQNLLPSNLDMQSLVQTVML